MRSCSKPQDWRSGHQGFARRTRRRNLPASSDAHCRPRERQSRIPAGDCYEECPGGRVQRVTRRRRCWCRSWPSDIRGSRVPPADIARTGATSCSRNCRRRGRPDPIPNCDPHPILAPDLDRSSMKCRPSPAARGRLTNCSHRQRFPEPGRRRCRHCQSIRSTCDSGSDKWVRGVSSDRRRRW